MKPRCRLNRRSVPRLDDRRVLNDIFGVRAGRDATLLGGSTRYIAGTRLRYLGTSECETEKRGRETRGSNCACRVVIYENECGQPWYVCERSRYVREPQLRAASLPRARRGRGDARPDDDDAQRRGGERPPSGDAHPPDALAAVPFIVPPLSRSSLGET